MEYYFGRRRGYARTTPHRGEGQGGTEKQAAFSYSTTNVAYFK